MKYSNSLEEQVGKKLTGYLPYDDSIALTFDNDTYLIIDAIQEYDQSPEVQIRKDDCLNDLTEDNCISLNICTKEEYKELYSSKYEKWNEEAKRMRKHQYEQLKKEFES